MNDYVNFNVIPAFSLETLADKMIEQMKNVAKSKNFDPMKTQTVLVMNPAQGMWLRQYIAQKNGICANIDFISPDRYFNQLLTNNNSATQIFEQLPLTWRVFKTLRSRNDHFGFNFRKNSETDLMILADNLAKLFWNYQTRRPEMINTWQRGGNAENNYTAKDINEDFRNEYEKQRELWRALALDEKSVPACLFIDFINNKIDCQLPQNIYVFAPTAMPRMYYQLLKKFTEKGVNVYFYYHNLSNDLWTETENEKKIAQNQLRSRPQLESEFAWIQDVQGNELLTSWGKAARKMAMQLIDDGKIDGIDSLDVVPAKDSLLHRVQAAIRENCADAEKIKFDGNDNSLIIHEAHSPMREIEIIYDDICKLFKSDSNLRSRDIIVMAPSIENYAQAIQSVFADSPFRYSIADRKNSESLPTVKAFLDLLGIIQDNLKLSSTLNLLENPALLKKLKLNNEQSKSLTEWILKSNFKNGYDAKTRKEELSKIKPKNDFENNDNNYFYQNSYAFAKRRILLGLAMGDSYKSALNLGQNKNDIAPLDNLKTDNDTVKTFDAFFNLIEHLQTLSKIIKTQKTPNEWAQFIKNEIVSACFDFTERNEEFFKICDAVDAVKISAYNANFNNDCDFTTFLTLLKKNIDNNEKHTPDILRGNITFCELQPMRNISSKAIYIIGLSNGEFPRQNKTSVNNLIDLWDKKIKISGGNDIYLWDRTTREDDCLLLLETILAAKKYLRLSFVGRSQSDTKSKPPCAPLNKFIDYLCGFFDLKKKETKKQIIRTHALQNFEDAGTQSPAIAKLANALNNAVPATELTPLPFNENEFKTFPLETLFEFYNCPAKFICEKRFAAKAPFDKKDEINDCEPTGTTTKKIIQPIVLDTIIKILENKGDTNPEIYKKFESKIIETVNDENDEISTDGNARGENNSIEKNETITLENYGGKWSRGWKNVFGNDYFETNKKIEVAIDGRTIYWTAPLVCGDKTKYYWFLTDDVNLNLLKAFFNETGEDFKLKEIKDATISQPNETKELQLKDFVDEFINALKLEPQTLQKLYQENKNEWGSSWTKKYWEILGFPQKTTSSSQE